MRLAQSEYIVRHYGRVAPCVLLSAASMRVVTTGMATVRESPGPFANNGRSDAGYELPRVLIASDVRLYREGLATILASLGQLSIVTAVAGSDLTLACLAHFVPDVVLLDMALPGCRGLPAALRSEPPVRFVSFAVSDADDGVLCLRGGRVRRLPRERRFR